MVDMNEENRFVSRSTIVEFQTLKNLTSRRIALTLWSCYVSRLKLCRPAEEMADFYDKHRPFLNSFGLYATNEEDTEILADSLNLNNNLKKIIVICLKKIRNELSTWMCSFETLKIGSEQHCILQLDTNWCVWTPRCDIDYKATAKKMISSSDGILTEAQKFAILSRFCLVEEIDTFSLDSLSGDFIQAVCFDSNPELYYWIQYKRNELNSIPLEDLNISLDAMMAMYQFKCLHTSVHHIDYFYQRLGANDQVSVVFKNLFPLSSYEECGYEKWAYVEKLISEMTVDQQRCLLSMDNVAERIIIASKLHTCWPECAVWAWRHSRSTISARTFNCILNKIIKGSPSAETVRFVISELWDTSTDEQKRDVLGDNTDSLVVEIIKLLSFNSTSTRYRLFELLNRYLALKNPLNTRTLVLNYSEEMALCDDLEYLQRIWDLYLPDPLDQSELKSRIANSISDKMKTHFGELWCDGKIDTLDANLEFYFPNNVNSMKQEVLQLMQNTKTWDKTITPKVIIDADVWLKFSQSIDVMFPAEDTATSLITKQHFISRFFEFFRINEYFRKGFDHVRKVVEEIFADQELNRIKKLILFNHAQLPCKYWLEQEICDVLYFHKVLEWCCGNNEEGISMFKEWCNSPDNIFDLCFFQLNKLYVHAIQIHEPPILQRLNKYLEWYLTEDQLKEYKKQKLDSREDLKIFEGISLCKDDIALNTILEWFFDDDAALLRDFKAKKMRRE